MSGVDVNNFLLSLAAAIASRASLVFAPTPPATERSLWIQEVVEGQCTDPASALIPYGGQFPQGNICRPTLSLQVVTLGKASAAVLAQAMSVHQAVLDDEGRPASHWGITGMVIEDGELVEDATQDWEIVLAMPLQRPGIIGRDDSGKRWMASGNWDIEYVSVAKPPAEPPGD